MLLFSPKDLAEVTERLLNLEPDPVPRLRLLRDGLRLDRSDPRLRKARTDLPSSRWVRQLQSYQRPDGTWGRFHSQDSSLKQPFPTTENAISQALASGMEKDYPVLKRVFARVLKYIDGSSSWPDPAEKHDNPLAWAVWVRHFSAAVLSQLDPLHPALDQYWQLWAEAVQLSFKSGSYDRPAEIAALNRLLDCRMKDPVPFHRKYPLLILSSTRSRLSPGLERKLLDYLFHAPQGIYYVCAGPLCDFPPVDSRRFWCWTQGIKLLARFPSWKKVSAEAANWVWSQRNADGLWDLGSAIARRPFTPFPLSESWKRPENRLIDSSVEMLDLLSRCSDGRQ